ncbi:MAG: cation:proton antiporter [Methanomicrobiaceae archaeon]|nr:cation:proton antiporter [Methanomicrobiaceae archaeon]
MQGIAVAVIVCLLILVITRIRGYPPIPFYILGGLILGASGLGIIIPDAISDFLTRLGLLFLLFTMGLEIRPYETQIRDVSFFLAGAIDLGVNILIGFTAGILLGFSLFESAVIASAFYISSSAMAVASLIQNKRLILSESETIVWLMVFEDIVFVGILLLLSTHGPALLTMIFTIVFAVLGIFAISLAGRPVITAILRRDDEVPTLFVFTLVLGAIFIADLLGIPETLIVIVLGSALSTTVPESLERQARPFREVFLVVFFVFFGISVDFGGGIALLPLLALGVVALASKFISGIVIGQLLHHSPVSGIEIWTATSARGEFSIALALIYGSPLVASTIAAMVVITSLCGSFLGRYTHSLRLASREFLGRGEVL